MSPACNYEKLRFFNLEPAATATGIVFLPPMGSVFARKLRTRARVLLWLDLGVLNRALKGVRVPFFEKHYDTIDFRRLSDGRYEPISPPQMSELNDQLEDGVVDCWPDISAETGLKRNCHVALVRVPSEIQFAREGYGLCPGPEVYWMYGSKERYGVAGRDWIFAGCLASAYFAGHLYVFYNRTTGVVRQIAEQT